MRPNEHARASAVCALALASCARDVIPRQQTADDGGGAPIDVAQANAAAADAGDEDHPLIPRGITPDLDLGSPRLLAPLSTARVTSLRPTLRWQLPPRATGAEIEICSDRACTQLLERFVGDGTSARVPNPLSGPGVVFWRARSTFHGVHGVEWSAVWQFRVPATDSDVDSSFGTVLDANGDGYADALVESLPPDDQADPPPASGWHIFLDAREASPRATWFWRGSNFYYDAQSAGDVNGDGFADLVMSGEWRMTVFFGSPMGPSREPDIRVPDAERSRLLPVGDVDSDGYADVLVWGQHLVGGFPSTTRIAILAGSPEGLRPEPIWQTEVPDSFVWGGCDLNGDGLADWAAAERTGLIRVYSGSDRAGPWLEIETGHSYPAVHCGDLNGDGLGDLLIGHATANYSISNAVYFGDRVEGVRESGIRLEGVHIARDLDGDCCDDLVALRGRDGRATLVVIHGSRDERIFATDSRPLFPGRWISGVSVGPAGDVDGDGREDLGFSVYLDGRSHNIFLMRHTRADVNFVSIAEPEDSIGWSMFGLYFP